jgi:hypothetical protein
VLLAAMFGFLASAQAVAGQGGENYESVAGVLGERARFDVAKFSHRKSDRSLAVYRWGISERETDDFTTVTGWHVGDSWHFGYQDGEDSGLSLLWQKEQDQMSISSEGIRFTRRF